MTRFLPAVAIALAGIANLMGAQSAGVPSTPAAQPQPQTVLHAQSSTVLVDVVVREKGKSVHGIDRSRFHVFEDGKEQTLSYFEEHFPAQIASVKHTPLPPHFYTNLPTQSQGGAVNVLLLDALNTPLGNQVEVKREMVKYLQTVKPGTTMAIFTLASRLRMVQGFTSNTDDLLRALKGGKANPQQSTHLDSSSGSATDSVMANLGMMNLPAAELDSIEEFIADVNLYKMDRRVAMTLQAMQLLARYLSAVPGRKNLIWFSGSFPVMLGGDSTSLPIEEPRSYEAQIHATAQMLSAARVAVYPMDALGLLPLANFGFDVNDGLKKPIDTTGPEEYFAMDELAKDTGGVALYNNNGFAQAVDAAVENGSTYYTVGYVPQSHDFRGQFRKLKVRLDQCDCQLAYRSGYFADPPGKPARDGIVQGSEMASATLHGAPPATQVLFQARVLPASDSQFKDVKLPDGPAGDHAATLKGPTRQFIVDLAADPRTVTFNSVNDRRQADLEFALVAFDADGKRVNSIDRSIQLALTPEQYARMMSSGLPVRMALDLPAGQDFLLIAVHDRLGVRVGSLEIPLAVAAR